MKSTRKKTQDTATAIDSGEFTRLATRVSLVSIVGNLLLSAAKLVTGIFAHSGAMISDAVHSASDIVSSIIVIIGVKFSAKASDREHPYGHERFECVAAILLSIILLLGGLAIGSGAVEELLAWDGQSVVVPGVAALVVAVVSILGKEAMYWYTRHYAKRLRSDAVMADAWHHRSDALSSVGALVGIVGARMGVPVMDTVASLIIVAFIIKAAYDIFMDAIGKMTDRSCSEQTERALRTCVMEQQGVLGIDLLRTRMFGNKIYVDIEILADGQISLLAAHEIAERVHSAIETRFCEVKHIMVHVNPSTSGRRDQ